MKKKENRVKRLGSKYMILLSALLSVFAFSVQAASPPPVADGRTDMLTAAHSTSNVPQPVVITEYYTYQYDNAALQPVKPPTPGNLYTTDTVSYCGNVVFGGDSIRYILVDGGYVTSPLTAPEYHFYLRDHLGSNRVVCSATGAVEQKNHSYPYGMPMDASTNASRQPYKYNGKELVRSASLNWLDYGARWHDPILGRWHSMDSKCEEYYSISPYAYCAGDPVNKFDSEGKLIIFVNGFHAGDGGTSSYWNGLDKEIMNYLHDQNARYIDGSIGGALTTLFTNGLNVSASQFGNSIAAGDTYAYYSQESNIPYENRYLAGQKYGEKYVKEIFSSLKGNEKIKIVTHSMGAVFAKGLVETLKSFATNNNLPTDLLVSELDLAPFQPEKQEAVIHTTQISHRYDRVAGYKPIKDAVYNLTRENFKYYFNITSEHSISSFSIKEIKKFWTFDRIK